MDYCKHKIDYLVSRNLERHIDDRGSLIEVLRNDWDELVGSDEQVKQVYTVVDDMPYIIRAFHKHERLIDWFHIANGSAMFNFIKGTEKSAVHERIILSAKKPQIIRVPTGVWHGWMSLEPNTVLISMASSLYNYSSPDEKRVPPNYFQDQLGDVWKIEAK